MRLVADSLPVLISYVARPISATGQHKAYERGSDTSARTVRQALRDVLGDAAYEELRPMFERVLAGERVTAERELAYKDGGARFVHIEYMPDRRDDGSVAGFYALVQDIGESKRAEQALHESEARFRAVADSAPAPVWVTDANGIDSSIRPC